MKRYFSHISVALIAVLQFSVCTGGVFSASLTFAGTALAQLETSTPSDTHLFICPTATENTVPMSSAPLVTHAEQKATTCTHGKACLTSSQQSVKNTYVFSFEPTIAHVPTIVPTLHYVDTVKYIVQHIEPPPSVSFDRNMVQRE